MKVLIVHPGPDFSVADVYQGWMAGLTKLGCEVREYNLHDRLAFYAAAEIEGTRLSRDEAIHLASNGLQAKCYQFEPDLVLVVSGFYITEFIWNLWKTKRQQLVVLFTESPYEDDHQSWLAGETDALCVVNDPINLDRYPSGTVYLPHAFDPDRHHPTDVEKTVDFSFVGTGYPSRIEFFEQVDWSGIGATFGGNWKGLEPDSQIRPLLLHGSETHCSPNEETVDLYRQSKVSANLYRGNRRPDLEANSPELAEGWAMGPREVELAACGTFFLREPRGEGDLVFPMLPTFTEPAEFESLLRYYLTHEDEREACAQEALAAVQDRTFENHARTLLQLL